MFAVVPVHGRSPRRCSWTHHERRPLARAASHDGLALPAWVADKRPVSRREEQRGYDGVEPGARKAHARPFLLFNSRQVAGCHAHFACLEDAAQNLTGAGLRQ